MVADDQGRRGQAGRLIAALHQRLRRLPLQWGGRIRLERRHAGLAGRRSDLNASEPALFSTANRDFGNIVAHVVGLIASSAAATGALIR
jgi:hypothetical protein